MLARHLVLVLATVEAWEASSRGRRALPSRMAHRAWPVAASAAVDSLQDVLRAAGLDEPQVEAVAGMAEIQRMQLLAEHQMILLTWVVVAMPQVALQTMALTNNTDKHLFKSNINMYSR